MVEFETTEEAVEALVLVNNLRVEGVQGEAEGMEFDIKLCFSRTFAWSAMNEGKDQAICDDYSTLTQLLCIENNFTASSHVCKIFPSDQTQTWST